MVAAFRVARHEVESSSAALRNTAARSSQGHDAHSRRASSVLAIARPASSAPASCHTPRRSPWSCGARRGWVFPVRISSPPMMTGMSASWSEIERSAAFSSARSGVPGAYESTGSLTAGGRRIVPDIGSFEFLGLAGAPEAAATDGAGSGHKFHAARDVAQPSTENGEGPGRQGATKGE